MGKNPAYSLRAFSRDLNISATSLSLILSGKQGLSAKKAAELASRMGLSSAESALFCDYVQALHGRTKKVREEAAARIAAVTSSSEAKDLSLEYFTTISDWYHFAILELTEVHDFQSDPRWIAERLGINEICVESAIQRLLKLDLLVEDHGKWKRASGFVATPSGIPSKSLKEHHSQLLEKAQQALHEQTVDERDISSITLAMNEEDLEIAKEELRRFRRALNERLQANPKKTSVYTLNISLFRLDKTTQKEKTK